MTRTRKTFFAMLIVTILGVGLMMGFKFTGVAPALPDPTVAFSEPQPVELTISSSVTKQRWMQAAITRFDEARITTASGRPIAVKVTGVLSGESMERILGGQLRPVVWSPGESSWVSQFDALWKTRHNTQAMNEACQPTVYTPSGIAMWRPMAEALGWPAKPVAWKTIIDLAADPQGWSRYGHPEWGKLKLGYTHPQYSSAGLLFMTSIAYGITGTTSGLTPDQVYAQPVAQGYASIAQNTAKYGMVTTALLDMMAQQGPDYLHAISAFEEGVVRFNLERGNELRFPLAFIFPAEGTFWSDHPYCILDRAEWVTPEQAEAAKLFREFLRNKDQQQLATEHMLRPLDKAIPSGSRLMLANGTLPDPRPETVPPFEVPGATTAAAVIDQFMTTKRKARALLVLDVSGSMNGEPIRAATEATAAFLKRLDPRDEVGLMVFNDKITLVSELKPASVVSEELSRRVLQLVSGGGTNLNAAICRAVETMNAKSTGDTTDSRLNGIVLLSDGADTIAEVTETRMFQSCIPASREAGGTKIFAIAFGEGANLDALTRISKATGGATFVADKATIDQAYLKISAEQ